VPFLQLYALALALVLTYVLLIWLSSLALRNASIIDIFWGLGFVLLAGLGFVLGNGYAGRRTLVAALVAIWGLRLSVHILRRNWGKPEDYRYRAWRKIAGERFWLVSLFRVFLLQGLLLWLIAAPILAAESGLLLDQLTPLDWGGLVVWTVGFLFEAVGDWQLERFRRTRTNRSELLRTGLWAFTRHPNYFGDATVWWGLFLIALGTPGGLLTLYSPLLMTILLLRVTGVAVLEKGLAKTKPAYKEYVDRTSAFFPWFPGKGATGTK
jgi:steroid 5-alpha reductase family enzyme